MKHITPTLLALAIAPCAMALDLTQSDADVKLGLSLQLQVRAQVSSAAAEYKGNVEPYDVVSGKAGMQSDDVDFGIRRARFGFKGSYMGDTKFALILTTDKTYTNSSPATLHNAWVGREIKGEGISHYIQAGLNSAFFNSAASINSSSTSLLPAGRATEALLAPRVVGVQYILTAPFVTIGFDVGNNASDDAVGSGPNDPQGEGLVYTSRIHVSPEGEWKIAKAQDTWMGKAGKGVLFALELGQNQRDNTTSTSSDPTVTWDRNRARTTTMVGTDVMLHMDGLSALASANYQREHTTIGGGNDDTIIGKNVYVLQAGYAMPCIMAPANVVEPAIRFQRINLDQSEKEVTAYGGDVKKATAANKGEVDGYSAVPNTDFGSSGYEYDLGVNYYFNAKANNKLSVQYTYWKAESGDGRAHIGMAQYQLFF